MTRYLISTRAVEDTCPCGTSILVGHDEGRFVTADSKPVDQAGELAALLDGCRTFALVTGELVYRSPGRIRIGLVGAGLFVEHRCTTYRQPSLLERIMT